MAAAMSIAKLLVFASVSRGHGADTVQVIITRNPAETWTISPYLASMSLVYSWAPDALYKNGSMADWARKSGIATGRYPAGQASYWNWEDPSGFMGTSTLDPQFDGKRAPAEDWMSMAEYLDLCHKVAMRPLIGVNYNCHGANWVSKKDSIARAVRQVKFVVSKGFTGAFYYIGNEDGANNHASLIAEHARAMKKIDPTMKVFWNDNNLSPAHLKQFLKVAGDAVDGAEFHGKWPFGGKPHIEVPTYNDWLMEVPLVEHKSNETWRQKIAALRQAAKEVGRPDLLLANNEIGLGKPNNLVGFNRYTKSLLAVELVLEMFVGGYDMTVFWDNSDGGSKGHGDQMLLDTEAKYRMNPMHLGFEMLFKSVNTTMVSMTTSQDRIHGFASHDDKTGSMLVYLINKFEVLEDVTVTLPDASPPLQTMLSMVDTDDHWGRVDKATAVHCEKQKCSVVLPPLSFTVLRTDPVNVEIFT